MGMLPVRYYFVICDICGYTENVVGSNEKEATKELREIGWSASHEGKTTCPDCSAHTYSIGYK